MDVDQLMAFDRIAREGSFSRAARGLQIAQRIVHFGHTIVAGRYSLASEYRPSAARLRLLAM